MNDRLRWGILGTGNIATQFAAGVNASRRGRLVAVGSRSSESSAAFAGKFQVPQAMDDYEKLIRTPDVDVVYNALPNSMHHRWTIAALRAGKHVLCEKPLAAGAAEAQEMFDVAAQTGRVLMEAFMYRSHPQTLAVLQAVRQGKIGELKLIRTSFCFRIRQIAGNIRFRSELAGGSLMDVGCYCINFSRLLAGAEPTRIDVVGHVHESGIDDLAAGTLTFPDSVVATFSCGMTVQADNAAQLCGSEGYIQIPVPWKPPRGNAGFTIGRSTPPRMEVQNAAPLTPPQEWHPVESDDDLYALEADDLAATILDGQPPRISADDSLNNMRVLDEMRRQLGIL